MTTTPNFRALAQELLQHARVAQKDLIGEGIWDDDDQDEGLFDRADKALATPPPKPPSDEELWAIGEDYLDDIDRTHAIAFVRAALERWGHG